MNGCPHCNGYKLTHLDQCDGCYEVRARLSYFLTFPANREFASKAMAKYEAPKVEYDVWTQLTSAITAQHQKLVTQSDRSMVKAAIYNLMFAHLPMKLWFHDTTNCPRCQTAGTQDHYGFYNCPSCDFFWHNSRYHGTRMANRCEYRLLDIKRKLLKLSAKHRPVEALGIS